MKTICCCMLENTISLEVTDYKILRINKSKTQHSMKRKAKSIHIKKKVMFPIFVK
jgi:hypothetical protein